MEINVLEIGALISALALFGVLYFLKRKHVDFGIRTLIATAFGVGLAWGSVYFETDRIVCPEIVLI